jgi:hypothetical protein
MPNTCEEQEKVNTMINNNKNLFIGGNNYTIIKINKNDKTAADDIITMMDTTSNTVEKLRKNFFLHNLSNSNPSPFETSENNYLLDFDDKDHYSKNNNSCTINGGTRHRRKQSKKSRRRRKSKFLKNKSRARRK